MNQGGVIVGEYDVPKSQRVIIKIFFKSSKLLMFLLNFKTPSKRVD